MKHIVTIGGGTGSFVTLTALKPYPVRLTAIVSMADDGGSTGTLRDEYGVLPPGDVRRALVALSGSSDTMRDLFNYRFTNGGLKGHSFGNLFIAALEKVTGSFASALHEASRVLNVKGEVAPVTLDNVRLVARLKDGTVLRGETNIDIPRARRRSPIEKIWLSPRARMNPSLRRVFRTADMIVIGPGDLYTSIVPNLLVAGVREEIRKSKAKKIYLCNLMTKRGETDGFAAADFVDTIEKYLGKNVLDAVLFNRTRPPERLLRKYRAQGAEFVEPPHPASARHAPRFVTADLAETDTFFRHSTGKKFANALLSFFHKSGK